MTLIFTCADIELLKLTAWCKHISLTNALQIFQSDDIAILRKLGLLSLTKDNLLRLPPAGIRFLEELHISYPQDKSYTSKTSVITRRIQSAALTLTCYRAGFNVFVDHPKDIQIPMTYLSSAAIRRNRNLHGNVLHNTRFSGILHSSTDIRLVHYIAPAMGTVKYVNEMQVFHALVAQIPAATSIIYAGKTYEEIWKEINTPELALSETTRGGSHPVSYGQAYLDTTVNMHLLSCDDTGAQQLVAMCLPNYRSRITQAAMGRNYVPPPENMLDWDGLYNGFPFFLAVDMDLKRIDRGIAAAKKHGINKIAIGALKGQHSGLLRSLYEDTADLFEISFGLIQRLYNDKEYCGLNTPSQKPFLYEGGYVHA